MDAMEKLEILTDAAKYDAACTSSGLDRSGRMGELGSSHCAGICHSFSADGRCIALLKVLFTNVCCYDCAYCLNRRSNDTVRTAFSPRELADLTIGFYRRNYIEGLFLSSGVLRDADYTMELLIETVRILRGEYSFRGYIHAKSIPGASAELVEKLGLSVDRMSVNIELPSQSSLDLLAPDKGKESVLGPMGLIRDGIAQSKEDMRLARRDYLSKRPAPFAPAGQSTQMIIGATPETDLHILKLTSSLYRNYGLKRVFYSAYLPVNEDKRLPSIDAQVPLSREHRLYQADWLLRYYCFEVDELLSSEQPELDLLLDPKAAWALRHMEQFPIEVNQASYEELLRIPGIGVTNVRKLIRARRHRRLGFKELEALGISLKRAGWFLTCNGKMAEGFALDPTRARRSMESSSRASGVGRKSLRGVSAGQMTLFDDGAQQGARDAFARPISFGKPPRIDSGRVDTVEVKTCSGLPAADPLLRGESA